MKKLMFLPVFACAMGLLTVTVDGQTTKTVYFVRHAEDQTAVFQQGDNGKAFLPLMVLLLAPGSAAGQSRPDLAGVWSTTLTIPKDDAWRVEDYGCFLGCPAPVYERLRQLLKDPANTAQPLGFVEQLTAPLPIRIEQRDDRVILSYEEWNVVRTIYMDGRSHPQNAPVSRYGHSVGRYEGSALVIETTGIAAGNLWGEHGGGGYTDRLRTVERYTRDDRWLKLVLTLHDATVFREPLVYEKFWRLTPGVEFLKHSCETIAGQP